MMLFVSSTIIRRNLSAALLERDLSAQGEFRVGLSAQEAGMRRCVEDAGERAMKIQESILLATAKPEAGC